LWQIYFKNARWKNKKKNNKKIKKKRLYQYYESRTILKTLLPNTLHLHRLRAIWHMKKGLLQCQLLFKKGKRYKILNEDQFSSLHCSSKAIFNGLYTKYLYFQTLWAGKLISSYSYKKVYHNFLKCKTAVSCRNSFKMILTQGCHLHDFIILH
jgi:hypothetical protein